MARFYIRSLALIAVFIANPIFAQSWSWNPAPSNAILMDVQRAGMMSSIRSQNNETDSDEAAESPAELSYTFSADQMRSNLQNFVNKTRAQDPVGAAQMEQLFGSVDVIGEIGKVMSQFGLSKDNAADAYAVYWVSAWQASVGDMSTKPAATYKLVAAQAALGLLQSPEFAKANDAQKQEMAEALLVQAALIDAHKESAAGNPEQLKAVANAVRQGAKASGLDLDKMTLTEEGFAPAKGGK